MEQSAVYDLSHPITDGMQTYPGDPAVHLLPVAEFEPDGYRVTELRCGSHSGTHIDAPSHTEPDGKSLGEFPIDRFRGEAIQVDCRDLTAREPIPAARVPETNADVVVFQTGWDEHWGTERYRDHPYLTPETARRCLNQGYDVGVDTLNPDPTPSPNATASEPDGLQAHRILLGGDRLIIENLTGLERLPERFEVEVYPLSFDGDGAPVRAVGVSSR